MCSGERERANLVVQLAAIFLYIYIGIYISGAAHTVIPIQRQHAHKIAISDLTIIQCTRDRYRRKMRLASESAEEEETRLSRRRGSS